MKYLIANKLYIIYDGNCAFCNKTVMFIAKNDRNNNFKFVSSLSEFGAKTLLKNKIKGLEKLTIILIEKEKFYFKSVAIRKILLSIPYFKILGYIMFLIPKKVSNLFYDFISNRRKRIIKYNDCEIPTSEIRKKFIM